MNTESTLSASADESHYVEIDGARIHYLDVGDGDPILFLHGVPASSYVWRNVIPHLLPLGRCIAPDLIGMGKSDKPNIEYTITDHIRYIEKFIETLKLDRITLVMHGWGSVIGFDFAMRHPEKCKGLVFYESYLRPESDEEVSLPYQEQLLAIESEEQVHDLVTNGADFIDKFLPQGMMHVLSKDEMREYRQPYVEKGSGKPLYQYFKDLPKNSQSAATHIIAEYSKKLLTSNLPKLMLYSVPGFITTIATIMWAKKNLLQLEIAEVGEELHYAQESEPALMGETISIWLQAIEQQH